LLLDVVPFSDLVLRFDDTGGDNSWFDVSFFPLFRLRLLTCLLLCVSHWPSSSWSLPPSTSIDVVLTSELATTDCFLFEVVVLTLLVASSTNKRFD
jgi:hypothetical protein